MSYKGRGRLFARSPLDFAGLVLSYVPASSGNLHSINSTPPIASEEVGILTSFTHASIFSTE
jgi:hypothetical protein